MERDSRAFDSELVKEISDSTCSWPFEMDSSGASCCWCTCCLVLSAAEMEEEHSMDGGGGGGCVDGRQLINLSISCAVSFRQEIFNSPAFGRGEECPLATNFL